MVDPDVILGEGVRIFNRDLVNLFGCSIGDHSFVGPFVEITRGVEIGRHCIVESHSFICTGVVVKDHVFIGHGVMFVNDFYPRTDRHVVYPRTVIEEYSSIGTNATVLGGVTVGAHSIIGAGSVVTRSVPPLSIAAGTPARVLRSFASLAELKDYITSRQASA